MIIVLDTETTGIEPGEAEVIEIGAVSLFNSGRAHEMAAALIKPTKPIPPETSAIHHLTDEDFLTESHFRGVPEAWASLFEMLTSKLEGEDEDYHIDAYAAHNADFDSRFLPDINDAPWLCTYRCASHLWPDSPGHGNQTLRYYLGLKPPLPSGLAPHRALYDALVTMTILQQMLQMKSLGELLALQALPILQRKVRFGKHRGALWGETPKDYLQWILKQDFDADVQYTARYWLDRGSAVS